MPTVDVLVVSHNSGGTVLRTIRALRSQTHPIQSIRVVDNASSDGTPAMIGAGYADVEVIALKENIGLSRARNLGLDGLRADLVWVVDDDIYPAHDALEKMVRAMAAPGEVAAVCPRIVFHPADDTVQCDGAAIHFAGMLTLQNAGTRATGSISSFLVGGFIGACVLFDRRLLQQSGGFDSDYFFYFEDMELSYRLRALGYSIVCEPGAVVSHDRGRGTPGLSFRGPDAAYPLLRVYYVLRHRWLTILLHYQVRTLVLLAPALVLYELASLLECLRRGWVLSWLRAASWIFVNVPRLLVSRTHHQRLRRARDREILDDGPLPFAVGFVRNTAMAFAIRLLGSALNLNWKLVRQWL